MAQTDGVSVLMVTLAMQGHMNPMLKFAKVLVSKGVRVTIATNDVARKRLLDAKNATTLSTPTNNSKKSPGIHLDFFSDGLSHEFDRNKNVGPLLESLQTEGAKNLSRLISTLKANGTKFSCLICNPFIPWVSNVAAEHEIPCAILWIQASTVYSIYYHYFTHPNLFPNDFENPNETLELPGLPVLEVRDLPTFIFPSTPQFRETLSDFVQSLERVKWLLGNSVYELEEEVVKSMASTKPIYPIGPLVSSFLVGKEEAVQGNVDLWSADDSCIKWLDKQPPSSVIYISFGSIILLSQQKIDSISNALRNANRLFLWVIRPLDKGYEREGGELSTGFLEEMKDKGLVVPWCPQERVLMHKALICFMTHCGWNSTLEAVAAGLPVIAYPEWTDQPTDAKLLIDVFKIGVRLRNDEDGILRAEDVEKCIKEITDGPRSMEFKERALELKEMAKKAIEDGGSSHQNIDRFVDDISKSFVVNNI